MNNDELSRDALLEALKASDDDLYRVTDDLVALLVKKNIILFTELPEPAQQKLLERESLRSKLDNIDIPLLSEDDTI